MTDVEKERASKLVQAAIAATRGVSADRQQPEKSPEPKPLTLATEALALVHAKIAETQGRRPEDDVRVQMLQRAKEESEREYADDDPGLLEEFAEEVEPL